MPAPEASRAPPRGMNAAAPRRARSGRSRRCPPASAAAAAVAAAASRCWIRQLEAWKRTGSRAFCCCRTLRRGGWGKAGSGARNERRSCQRVKRPQQNMKKMKGMCPKGAGERTEPSAPAAHLADVGIGAHREQQLRCGAGFASQRGALPPTRASDWHTGRRKRPFASVQRGRMSLRWRTSSRSVLASLQA